MWCITFYVINCPNSIISLPSETEEVVQKYQKSFKCVELTHHVIFSNGIDFMLLSVQSSQTYSAGGQCTWTQI